MDLVMGNCMIYVEFVVDVEGKIVIEVIYDVVCK